MSDELDHKASIEYAEGKMDKEAMALRAGAIDAENAEHSMTVLQAVRAYPMATFWAFVMSSTIVTESYDVFLTSKFLALDAFPNRFGVYDPGTNGHVNVTKWQSVLQMSGQLGALIGVFLAGPITSRIGYRLATLLGLMLLNAMIFISYFANSLLVFFAGQLLEGIPWGISIANAPAYCSEIVPLRLRAPATQMLQMFWAIGRIIVGAVTFNPARPSMNVAHPAGHSRVFRARVALVGREAEALRSVERLGRRSNTQNMETVAMIRRVVELEKSETAPSYTELFKGSDLRLTLIVTRLSTFLSRLASRPTLRSRSVSDPGQYTLQPLPDLSPWEGKDAKDRLFSIKLSGKCMADHICAGSPWTEYPGHFEVVQWTRASRRNSRAPCPPRGKAQAYTHVPDPFQLSPICHPFTPAVDHRILRLLPTRMHHRALLQLQRLQ
ncbi:hypothetical protein CVT26_000655 [Gymnopilus dilepis]|uniref:Major facilitator superfamily (MFS) profile domain-containing protein n=1 Tax=Gymnopilus dilepis TaxID=231916 RepID=A0A409Y2R0_9AGAR|nr:hypothetical protein CVT26_000655 [Gymnopilus dilepis]